MDEQSYLQHGAIDKNERVHQTRALRAAGTASGELPVLQA
jgi:hypothetical protein